MPDQGSWETVWEKKVSSGRASVEPGSEKQSVKEGLGGGRHAMSLLAHQPSLKVLNLLSKGAMTASELAEAIPDFSRSAIYRYAELLQARGAVTQRPRPEAGRSIDLVLTDYGQALPDLAMLAQQWFDLSPLRDKPRLETDLGRRVIESRAAGWGQQILWELEGAPRLIGRLESRLGAIPDAHLWGFESASSIRRRVQWMEETGQIEAFRSTEGKLYRPTPWAWRGAGCLALSLALEMHYRPQGSRPPSVRVVAFGLVQGGHILRAGEGVTGELEVVIPIESTSRDAVIMTCLIQDGQMVRWSWGPGNNPRVSIKVRLLDGLRLMVGMAHRQPEVRGDTDFYREILTGIKEGMFVPELDQ